MFRYFLIFIFFAFVSNAQELDIKDIQDVTEIANLRDSDQLIENPQEMEQKNNDLSLVELEEDDLDSGTEEDDLDSGAEEEIFGLDYFNTVPTSITSTSDLPVPYDYRVSLNDELKIILSGNKTDVLNLKVNLDGTIFIPEIGAVQVSNKSVRDVSQEIKDLVKLSYVGVEAQISLSKLSARKISIIGAVKNPGTYLVNPFTTISNSLAYSGGIEDYASLRDIKLISGDNVYVFDLYDLLIRGDRTKDLSLQQGDTILVGGTSNLVKIYGQVLRPKTYHYKPNDTYRDLINFSLGFTADADQSKFYASVKNGSEVISKEINLDKKIQDDEVMEIYVNKDLFIKNKNIQVRGNGVKETVIDYKKFDTLPELVNELSFSDDIYPYFAILEQTSGKGQIKEVHYFSIYDINNIELKDNIEIYFFDRQDITNLDTNTIFSDRIIPQRFYKNILVGSKQLPFLATGDLQPKQIFEYFEFNERANTNATFAVTNNGLIDSAYKQTVNSDDLISIFIPEMNPENISVTISGLVSNPGEYILSPNSTLQDLYEISGQLLQNANEDGIFFTRVSLKEIEKTAIQSAKNDLVEASLIASSGTTTNNFDFNAALNILNEVEDSEFLGRLTGNLSVGSLFAQTLVLEDGDTIFVPPFRSTVTIQGQVLSPTTTMYQADYTVDDYISAAGGFSESANSERVYIVKANGSAEEYKKSYFTKNYVPEPGDTIIVPLDYDRLDPLSFVSVAAQILSNITFSAASLNAISN